MGRQAGKTRLGERERGREGSTLAGRIENHWGEVDVCGCEQVRWKGRYEVWEGEGRGEDTGRGEREALKRVDAGDEDAGGCKQVG